MEEYFIRTVIIFEYRGIFCTFDENFRVWKNILRR